MGCDKTTLPASPYRNLLERQLAVLAALAPCERIISARTGQLLPSLGDRGPVAVACDDGVAGPLGGLVSVLRVARAPRVLLLGVDLARVDAGMLRRVIGAAPDDDERVGVIPRTAASVQPLAALWPRSILPLAEARLAAGMNLALRSLVEEGHAAGLLRLFDVPVWDEWRFANWNRPGDVLPFPHRVRVNVT